MSWQTFRVSSCGTHHIKEQGQPAYEARFDEVLKFHAPGLAPVQRGGEAWHVRCDGTPAYRRRFRRTFGFYEGLAAVEGPDGAHHIGAEGQDAYSEKYDWCGNFQQGRCTVRNKDNTYHHITREGVAAYSARWCYAGDYRDGIAVVQAACGHSTHVDLNGILLHGVWFVDLDIFHKGYARARDDEGWMHVNLQGRPAYRRRFQAVEPFYNGQARVERFDGALEVIDESGTTLVELRPARQSEFASLSRDMVGFWRTQTIGTAVSLGVIEALPATRQAVADRCNLSTDGTQRLLRALGELGLAVQDGEYWKLTMRGGLLRADHSLTLADAAIEYAGPLSTMWRGLPDALRKNTNWTAPDVFGEVGRDEKRRVGHHRMLRSYARHDYTEVCLALGLTGDEHIIDAGGGVGVLAQLILSAHPNAEVTVLERAEVVAMANAVTPGLRWRSGNLFEPWEIEGDAVLLSRVLHDWDDLDAIRILTHARASLPAGGRIYIVEMLVPEESVAGALCDLHLLMATGGRERSSEQIGELLLAAGFELSTVRRLPALPSVAVGVAL
ncbi:methyltransferase [Lujinxingia vulgaris]|uniref:Methyltransferase n=1 Tax=Lujinxingia vulgaris TaxID=2600176 RepID=A0A5C6XJ07_9DELT|nr:methyltransferase [Lujinxingia vulgaris]TXD39508.1 methyltransferase [Lujinxingia vulgaris]